MKEWKLAAETRPFRQLLIGLKLAASGSEADQKLKGGAVRLDGRKVAPFDPQQELLVRGREHVLEIGRRAYLLRIT